jgi:hypothetical protein
VARSPVGLPSFSPKVSKPANFGVG